MQNDQSPYDLLGSHYAAYARTRSAYLSAVDRIIVQLLKGRAESILDIGSGDGRRITQLAASAGIKTLFLVDPSKTMCELSREMKSGEVYQNSAEALPEFGIRFDAVTCLWNVLGHVASTDLRVEALRRMRSQLNPGGQIFLDVNNRYNAKAYGWLRTGARMVYDLVHPSETNGDVIFNWKVGEAEIPAKGHVFRPSEVEELFRRVGLKVTERVVVDYDSGAKRRRAFEGQLFYVMEGTER